MILHNHPGGDLMLAEHDQVAHGAEAPRTPKGILRLQRIPAAGAVIEFQWASQERAFEESGWLVRARERGP